MSTSIPKPIMTWAQVAATPAPKKNCVSTQPQNTSKDVICTYYNDNSGRMLPVDYRALPGQLHHEHDWESNNQ